MREEKRKRRERERREGRKEERRKGGIKNRKNKERGKTISFPEAKYMKQAK